MNSSRTTQPTCGRLLTYRQAAKLLNIPVGTLYAWVSEHRIPHIRLSARTIRFDTAALESWIEARVVQPD